MMLARWHRHTLPGPRFWAFAISVVAVGLAGCRATATPSAPATLRVAGSTSMLPLLQDLAAAFTQSREQTRVEITGGGSRLGLDRALLHEIDLAACSWLESDADAATPQAYTAVPIAWDGIAIIVHPSNRLDGLTLLQLKSIYAGWLFDWQELGGGQADILIVSREDGSGTRSAFEHQVLGDQPVALTAIVMPSTSAVLDYVSRHVAAVGYISMGAIRADSAMPEGSASPVIESKVKVLEIEGSYPTPETVKQGVYHLSRPLYLVAPGKPQGLARDFIDFVLSPAGQTLVGQRFARIR